MRLPAACLLIGVAFAASDARSAFAQPPADSKTDDARLTKELQAAHRAGKLEEAERLAAERVELRKKIHGPAHDEVLNALLDSATVLGDRGKWAAARDARKEVLAVVTALRGKDHWTATGARAELEESEAVAALSPEKLKKRGEMLRQFHGSSAAGSAGKFRPAALLAKLALAAYPDVYDRPTCVLWHLQLRAAWTSWELGEAAVAEQHYRDALDGRTRGLGANHPDTAQVLNGLAELYWHTGDREKAGPLYTEALKRLEAAYGPDRVEITSALLNSRKPLREAKKYAEYEAVLRRAREIRRKALGDQHPLVTGIDGILCWHYRDRGDLDKAEEYARKSLEGRRAAYGDRHPDTADSYLMLAFIQKERGRHAEADPEIAKWFGVIRAALGQVHVETADYLSEIAALDARAGRWKEAFPRAKEAVDVTLTLLDRTAVMQSERQQLAFAARAADVVGLYLTVAERTGTPAEDAYTVLLRAKGAVTARQKWARTASQSPEARKLAEQLAEVSLHWGALAADRDADPAKLKELGDRRDRLEADLSRLRGEKAGAAVTPNRVRELLPDGAALVDFIDYLTGTKEKPTQKTAAFVVRKDGVTRVELGETASIGAAVDRFRGTLARAHPVTGKDDPAVTLRDRVWGPLQPHLKGTAAVLVSPDGALCRLPFAALPTADGTKYLIEQVAIAVLPVPQLLPELLAKRDKGDAPPSLLAVGDVEFDPGKEAETPAGAPPAWSRRRAGGPMRWAALPGTRAETAALEAVFQKAVPTGRLEVLRGAKATEIAVRERAPKFEYLHFATHGFFAPAALASAAGGRSGGAGADAPGGGHNPGLLSGLVFAGANRPPRGTDDGVLTALEISDLDLGRVELAVLSACETGLGEVAGGEGVFGLQRAFQVAGAKTTVTSLWKVNDDATRRLMDRFYDGYWAKGRGALEALRDAQLGMLRDEKRGATADDGKEPPGKGRTPPSDWAAFTLSGDWR